MRGLGEAEQQADLGDGVADHADDDDAVGPTHGVGGGLVGDVEQAEAVVGRGEHHAGDAEQRLAQRDGIYDREQDQPWQRVAAEGGCGDQVTHGEEADHGQQLEQQADGHEGHAAEQNERGGEAAAWGFDFVGFGAVLAVLDGGHLIAVGGHAVERLDWAADRTADHPCDGDASQHGDGEAPGGVEQNAARPGGGGHDLQPAPQQGDTADGADSGDGFGRDVVEEA